MSKYVLLSDLEEAKEVMYDLDKSGVFCVRMTNVRRLAKEDDLGEYSGKLWKNAYERGKAEMLSVIEDIKTEISTYKDDKIIHFESNCMIDIVLDIIDKHLADMRGKANETNN